MVDIPVVVTKSGMQPTSPDSLHEKLLAAVAALVPGYTANLPGSLVEDISSTDVAATVLCDSARVEAVNSLTPHGANEWLLTQLGEVYGVRRGEPTLTSVGVVFVGAPGFVVPAGFSVSDGLHQYVVRDGGAIGASGFSVALYCEALETGTWGIPAGTVAQVVDSVPSGVALTCSNPLPGVPGAASQSAESYRGAVLRAGLAASQGMPRYVKTLLGNVEGVQPRLVGVRQVTGVGWEVIVGGGDTYAVAHAILSSVLDPTTLVGSVMTITNITKANPAVVTTGLHHGYAVGQVLEFDDVLGMTAINGIPVTVATVLSPTSFATDVDSSAMGAYVSGGVITPNLRNEIVSLNDYPDVYQITFVRPPLQDVGIVVTWGTSALNFVNSASVAQLAAPAIAKYVNNIAVGQPMILYELQTIFQAAVSPILPPAQLTRMVFEVSVSGVGVDPSPGTGIISGDPESGFQTATDGSGVVVLQG